MIDNKFDENFWISQNDDSFFLMHRIPRPELRSHSEICVGEAFINEKGYWEVRVSFRSDRLDKSGQILVGITDSPLIAVSVLWEKRELVHWGYFQ